MTNHSTTELSAVQSHTLHLEQGTPIFRSYVATFRFRRHIIALRFPYCFNMEAVRVRHFRNCSVLVQRELHR